MDIRVLGPVEVLVEGRPIELGGPKQRAVLGLLVAAAPRLVASESLIAGLWGDEPSSGARSTLQTYVSNLRHVLGESVVFERGGYRLAVDPEGIDAFRFQSVLERARTALATEPDQTARHLREALSWWRGRPYADLGDVPGLDAEMRRLGELRLEAVELRIDAELAAGRHGALIAELEALAEEHPLRERFRSQHMLALYRSGRQGEALRAFRRTEAYLSEELGVEPSAELRELELKILEHDEALLGGASRAMTQRLAFLVTDIEGSTRLWDKHPQAMAAALATHDRLLEEAVSQAAGRVFKHTGDGVLAVFSSAAAGVEAAEAALRALTEAEWGEVGPLRVRMAIDVGEVEARGDDFFGPPLNRAARLCAIAHGGQVLVSAAAQAEVTAAAPAGLQVRHLGEVHLRGMAAPERVAQMVFVGLPADFPDLRTDADAAFDERASVVSLPGYEVREQIGEGAFGVVWKAYQPSVGREVAVKAIRPDLVSKPSFARRFEAEARTIARLAHPHIVPMIDFWRDAERAYLVLALLPGGSLEMARASGRIDRTAGRRILAQIGSALDHAHSHGLAHGDLKPANVLLDGSGNAYLSDFGIASRLIDPNGSTAITSSPRYRAPEERETGPSPPADLFALGMLARDLLDGVPDVEPALARATAPNPSDRYPTAAAFLADLAAVLGRDSDESVPRAASRNPYKGLRSFDEADAPDFHGRDDLVAALVAAVSRHRFVTVVGPSGSGKSSVVKAGLLPSLAAGAVEGSERWFHLTLTPGPRPVEALVEAVARLFPDTVDPTSFRPDLRAVLDRTGGDGELLVVVDQFEELYTLVDGPERRQEFIDLLVREVQAADSRVRVVATLRADFYDRPLADEVIGPLVRDGQVTVLPPSPDEFVAMITAPAQAVGLRWEPGLPHRIAGDVAHQSGALPLLQYALTELVERRSGDLLTGADYARIGGVAGALAGRAETLYQTLTPSQQETARQVFLRLVTVGEDTDDTRRRVRRSELESLGIDRGDLDVVLDSFVADRLLLADRDPVTRGPTIEVAHEALLREWPRLGGWIDDQREALILGRRFRAALAEWEANGEHADYLLTGSRLAPFSGWAETAALTPVEREYYRSSQARDDSERTARRRRRRALTGVLATAALVASVLGAAAMVQANRATAEAEQAAAARDAALVAESRAEAEREAAVTAQHAADQAAERADQEARMAVGVSLAASAAVALDSDPALAKLLAVASTDLAEPTVDTLSVLHAALARDRVIGRYEWPADIEVNSFWTDLHPGGSRLVASGYFGSPSTHLEVYDFDHDEVLWAWDVPGGDRAIVVDRPRFVGDGSILVHGVYWQSDVAAEEEPPADVMGVHIRDAGTGELVRRIDLGRCGGLVVGAAETHLAVVSVPESSDTCFDLNISDEPLLLELVSLADGERRVVTDDLFADLAAMSGDGSVVAFLTWEVWEASVADTDTLAVRELPGTDIFIDPDVVHLNHDGSLLVLGNRPIALFDVATAERLAFLWGHAGSAWSFAFDSGGDRVYSSGREGTVRALDTQGRPLAAFPAVGSGRLSMTEQGRMLVTSGDGRGATLLDLGAGGETGGVSTCDGFGIAGTLQVAGGYGVHTEYCGVGAETRMTTFVSDLAAGEVSFEIADQAGQRLATSPDGRYLARQDADASPGEYPLDWAGSIRIRELRTGMVVSELQGLCNFTWTDESDCAEYPDTPFRLWALALAWSADGRWLAAANHGAAGNEVVAWDVESGKMLGGYDGCLLGAESVLFTADASNLLVACSEEGAIVRVSTTAWQETERRALPLDVAGRDRLGFIGYTAGDEHILAVTGVLGRGGGSLLWTDPLTLEVVDSIHSIHAGSPKSWTMNADRTLAATGSSDGFVKVWDLIARRLHQEIYLGAREGQGVAFVDDGHLAVVTSTGGIQVYTLDPDELVAIARASLSRGFTAAECQKYFAGGSCPALPTLRGE